MWKCGTKKCNYRTPLRKWHSAQNEIISSAVSDRKSHVQWGVRWVKWVLKSSNPETRQGERKKREREWERERKGGREVCVCICVKGNVRLRVKDMVAGSQCHSPCSVRAKPRIISKSPSINYSHSAVKARRSINKHASAVKHRVNPEWDGWRGWVGASKHRLVGGRGKKNQILEKHWSSWWEKLQVVQNEKLCMT